MTRRPSEHGSALVSTLAMLSTAALLVMALVAVSRTATTGVATYTDLMRSAYVAEGAANRIRYLIEADRQLYNSRSPDSTDYDEVDFDRYLADGLEHTMDYYGTPVRFFITDAVAGVPLVSTTALEVFAYDRDGESAVEDALTAFSEQLQDYIDTDSDRRDNGLEVDDYEDLDDNALPRNDGLLQLREELLWLPAAAGLLPVDHDGRLSIIRHFGVASSAGASIYTVNYGLLRRVGTLTDEQARQVLDALEKWRSERLALTDQLDELVLPQLQQNFSWSDSGYYTIDIRQSGIDGRPGYRQVATFQAEGVAGPSDGIAVWLEYLRF